MQKPFALIATVLAALAFSQSVLAEDNDGPFFGHQAKGKWLIGIKAAKIDNNQQDIKDADGIGIVLGYEFARPIGSGGSSTVELEYIDGDKTDLAGLGIYDANALNLFFTYRSPGTLYFKAKAGLSYTDIEVITPGLSNTFEDVALALGVGLGVHISDYGVLELEYSTDSGDGDLGIIGVNALLEF